MALADADIEWIVREVVRRLRGVQEDASASSNGKAIAAAQRIVESLELNEPVITLATLDKRLSGIRRVVVSRRAVVTPAVVDELRDRKIELVRCGKINAADANRASAKTIRGPLVVAMAQSVDAAALRKVLSGVNVINEASPNSAVVLEHFKAHVAKDSYVVLLTNAPSAAVVALNRDPTIRAALGFNFPTVRQAVDDAGANVLAIDPSGKSTTQLAGMINEFLKRT